VEEKRSGLGLARPVKLNVKRAASVNEKKGLGLRPNPVARPVKLNVKHGLGFSFHITLFSVVDV
jgi:hypothetical protein